MKRKILASAVALVMGTMAAHASTILDGTKEQLRANGMIVQDRNSMSAYVDCLVSDADVCQNYANTSLLYSGNLFPCAVDGCNEAGPGMPIPIPGGDTVEFKASATWTIETNEAMVMYGILPPGVTHFGYETLIYERSESEIPNPGGKTPLQEGENPPDKKRENGVIVDASVGETRNEFTMKNVPNPEALGEGQVFVHIATPNQLLAAKIKRAFIDNGYPEEGINIKGLPERHFTFSNDPAIGDSFRTIGRFARPFENEDAVMDWTSSKPVQLMRVTANEDTGYIPFQVEELLDRETGRQELKPWQKDNYRKWLRETKREYGKYDASAVIKARDYVSEHCIETGSYCWGNNLDALYVDINDPETDKMMIVDFSRPDSQLVITGVDHVATNYAKFWNFGFYDPDSGKAIATIDFDKVQLQEYDNRRPNRRKPITYIERSADKKFFRLAVKADCTGVNNCFEIDTAPSGGKFKIMMRTYVNPQTGTGPDYSEVVNPEFWVY